MSELKNLSIALEGGVMPTGYDEKAVGKLSKTYLKLNSHKVVNLYPIRSVTPGEPDYIYCLYACPLKGTEIDETILQSIKADVDTLEIGEIRYDSVQSSGYDYYIVDPETGRHIVKSEDDLDSVMQISDQYDGIILFTKSYTSPKKAPRLDCHYAIIGIEKEPNEFKIETIPNEVIGQAPSGMKFENPAGVRERQGDSSEISESPASEKYSSAMKILSIIITIAVLIWYFFLR